MPLMSVTEDFVVKNGLVVQGTTAVTTSTGEDGSLQSSAGIATQKNLIVGTTATVWGDTNLQGTLSVGRDARVNGQLNIGPIYSVGSYTSAFYINQYGIYNEAASNNQIFQLITNITTSTGGTLTGVGGGIWTGDGTGLVTYSSGDITFRLGTTLHQGSYPTGGTNSSNRNIVFSSTGSVTINSTDPSSTYQYGALVVKGGVGIAGAANVNGALKVGGNTTLQGQLSVSNASTFTGTLFVGDATTLHSTVGIDGILTLSNFTAGSNGVGALVLTTGGMSVAGDAYFNNGTVAGTNGAGAVHVAGGVYVGNNVIIAGTEDDLETDTGNALYVAGGVWIDKSLKVVGPTSFADNVTFNGGATFVLSTNTYYTDNMIELHVPPGGVDATWASDDLKDIGLRFHYYQGSDKNAALILANDTHYLEWYNAGTENSSGTFVGSSYGTFKTGSVILSNTTASTSTTSGALVVAGGVGIGGGMYVRGVITGTVTTSTNISGGSQGRILIQSAAGKTSFIPAGTGDGQVLTWNASGTTATWQNASGTTVGNASYAITATNISGGAQYDIPYQSANSSTTFDVIGDFQYHYDSYYLKIANIQIWGDGTGGGPGTANNQIVDTNGLGIEMFSPTSTGSVQLNWDNTTFIKADSSGIALTTNNSNTATLDNSGKLSLPGILKTDQSVGAPLINGTTDQITMYDTGGNWNYAQGIEDQSMWFQIGNNSTGGFKWYRSGSELLKLSAGGSLIIASGSTATTTGSGALIVTGGIKLGKNIFGGAGISATQGNQSADLVLQGGAYLGGNTWIESSQIATSTGTAALSLKGGIYAGSNLIVKSSSPTFNAVTGGAVSVTGGVGIAKDLYVGTTATFNSNVGVSGNISLQNGDITGVNNLTAVNVTATNINTTGTIEAVTLNVSGSAIIHGIYITQYGATLTNLLVTGTTTVSLLTADTLQVNSTLSNYTSGNAASTSNYSIATLGGIKAANDIIAGGIVAAGDFSDTAHPTPRGNDSGTVDGFYLMNNMQSARSLRNISGSGTITIDSWSKSLYTSAKYIVQVVDGSSIHTEEMLLIQDGTTVYMSQYGLVYNNSPLGVFDGTIDGTVDITFTPTGATNMSIQVVRQAILTTTENYG